MGYELRLVIGETWNFETEEYLERMREQSSFERTVRQIAEIELSGVGDKILALHAEAVIKAKARFEETGEFFTITTGVQVEEEGETVEKNHERDSYGDFITVIPLIEVYRVLLQEQADVMKPGGSFPGRGYRNYAVALALIVSVLNNFDPDRAVALTYGH